LFIFDSIYYDNFSRPSLTSLTLSNANFFRTGIKLRSEISSGYPVHVEIAIPFLGCNLKFDAILSIMIDFDKSLPIIERSFILT
jgi:hypothetical protein